MNGIEPFILPAPSVVIATLIKDWGTLSLSLLVTLRTMAIALLLATFGGVLIAVIFAQSRLIERSLYPFAVILQVTPIVAIAPLLLVYLNSGTAILVCAFIVAFFPILSNTTLGLASTDPQPAQPLQALRSGTLARARAVARALGLALFPRRLAHRGRPCAHRGGGRRDRGGLGRAGLGPRLPHRRIGLSPQHPAHVRGFAADLARPASSSMRCWRSSRICCCVAGTKARSIGEGRGSHRATGPGDPPIFLRVRQDQWIKRRDVPDENRAGAS